MQDLRLSQIGNARFDNCWPGDVHCPVRKPEDVHTVSRNASKTKPAKFVVFFIKDEGAPILTPFTSFGREQCISLMKPFLPKSNLPYVEARVNSKAAQLTENGAKIICLFARFALGASFISAVADRFGL